MARRTIRTTPPKSTAVLHARAALMGRVAELMPTYGIFGIGAFFEGAVAALEAADKLDEGHTVDLLATLRKDLEAVRA